jgi:hypothetical protein
MHISRFYKFSLLLLLVIQSFDVWYANVCLLLCIVQYVLGLRIDSSAYWIYLSPFSVEVQLLQFTVSGLLSLFCCICCSMFLLFLSVTSCNICTLFCTVYGLSYYGETWPRSSPSSTSKPETDMSRLGIEPGPPRWEASTLAKSYLNSLLLIIRNISLSSRVATLSLYSVIRKPFPFSYMCPFLFYCLSLCFVTSGFW